MTASDNMKVPTMHWLSKLHKTPYKCRSISVSSKCTTTYVSYLLISALTTIETLIFNFCNKCYVNSTINYFWSVKNSIDILDKLKFVQVPFLQ